MSRALIAVVVFALAASGVAQDAFADEMFVTGIPTAGIQNFTGSLADSFTVGATNLSMNSVGVFDSNQDGLLSQITFELWSGGEGSVAGRTLLYSHVFATGSGTLIGNHRFFDLTAAVLLGAGQSYTVLAYGYNSSELNYNENFNGPDVAYSSVGLTAGNGGYGNAAASPNDFTWAPNGPWTSGNNNFGVATFSYTPVPEPTALALFGLGLAAAGAASRRKRKQRA